MQHREAAPDAGKAENGPPWSMRATLTRSRQSRSCGQASSSRVRPPPLRQAAGVQVVQVDEVRFMASAQDQGEQRVVHRSTGRQPFGQAGKSGEVFQRRGACVVSSPM
jgi:hypothetical protein